ncbi:uncharacterized protein [Parasteatoda tepidariorum]|uniref:uncharacterized protein n=1 Tax=Parasteatoda tepidariorum TaxID=114398 RepID=UPI00077F81CF|nr:uncharacterized protein LOC107436642 [Parasteatoda tepidariorum]
MKLNATPRHYMPLSQNQSDEDESGPSKEDKCSKLVFKSSFDASAVLTKTTIQSQVVKVNIKSLPMSPLRKLAFITSLIMCVLFVIIFVYFIPCTPAKDLARTYRLTYKWKRIFHNMSFTTPLEFVKNNVSKTSLIILGCNNGEPSLIAIQENNGKERWKLHFHSALFSSICNVLDLNSDGIPECLIIGNNGLFAAVDVEKGATLWYLHNHSDILSPHSIYGPAIVPDCDDDGILDIILSYYMEGENEKAHLAFVSGATGQIIGNLLHLPHCTSPVTETFTWNSQNESHIVLYCSENGNGNLWMISTREACDTALKVSTKLTLKNIFKIPPFAQDIHFYKLSTVENQLVIVLDGIKFLLLEKHHNTFQLKWKTYVEGEQHTRILTDGQFIKGGNQLMITTVNPSSSTIMGIDLNNGKVTTIAQVVGSVKGGVKLVKYFGVTDGVILKTITSKNFYEAKGIFQDYDASSSNESYKYDDFTKANLTNDTRVFRENYVLLKSGKLPKLRKIRSEKVLVSCKGDECYPDAFIKDSTISVKKAELDISFDVMTVTSTLLPASSSVQEMIVNFFNLENISTWPSCYN